MESTEHPEQKKEDAADGLETKEVPRSSPRRLLIAGLFTLVLLPFNAQFVLQSEMVYYAGFPTTISFFYHAVFVVFVLSLLNSALKRWLPALALRPAELALIYIGLCIASSVAGHDGLQVLAPTMAYGHHFATPENGWAENILPDVPSWLTVSDPHSLKELHEGGARIDDPTIYRPWLKPGMWWTLFMIALHTGTHGLVSFFRRRWIESERLSFPIVQLPMELMHRRGGFFREPSLWIAFFIVLAIDLLNGLNELNPIWPMIPTRGQASPAFHLGSLMTDVPWNAIGEAYISFYPIIIGLGLLLPTELAFSCWFFFLFWRAERIIVRAWGMEVVPEFPYIEAQALGGYAGIAFFAIWVSRGYVWQALQSVFGRGEMLDMSREAMSYRSSLLLFLGSLLFLVIFSVAAGMQVLYAVAFFLIYFVIAFSISRIRAEMGLPAHDLHFAGPTEILTDVLGTANIPARTRVVSRMYYWFNRAYRHLHAPHQIEALKISEQTGLRARTTSVVVIATAVIGTIVAFWALLWCWAEFGAAAKIASNFGPEIYNQMNTEIMTPTEARTGPLVGLVIGVVFMVGMLAIKMRVPWFPVHPAGFAVSATWTMQFMWCPLLIAWAVKSLVSRYGGGQAYKKLVPIAFGLILGDLIGGVWWSGYGIYVQKAIYSIFQ